MSGRNTERSMRTTVMFSDPSASHSKTLGIPADDVGGRGAIPRRVLGVPEDLVAVAVQAAGSLGEVSATSVELGEMRDQLDRRVALAIRENLHAREERVI